MKALAVTQVVAPNGFRILAPNDINFLETSGLVPINGNSGAGKTSLLEIMKLATQGKSALRDDAFIREGENECEIMVKIADVTDPEGLSFYLCANAKPTGEVDYKFKANVDGKLKNVTEPIAGLGKITPAKLMLMMSTTITYGANEFMSENEKVITEFIFKTFPEVSEIAKPIQEKIDQAVKERDRITERQTAIGAYNNKLEGIAKPAFINVDAITDRRNELIQQLADAKAEDKAGENNKEERLRTKRSELENIRLKATSAKEKIEGYNSKIELKETNAIFEINSTITEHGAFRESFIESLRHFRIQGEEPSLSCLSLIDTKIKESVDSKNNRPALNLIPIANGATASFEEGSEAAELFKTLVDLRAEYKTKFDEITAYEQEETPTIESKAPAVQLKLDAIDAEMQQAQDSNATWEKFDVLERHTEAHQKVLDLRAERNKLYESINTGVKGLTIQLADEDGKKLCFYYTGEKDPEYFTNADKHPRPLTSYSQTQKTFVAMMMALALMNKKQFPLNVIFIDNTGMDKRIYKMFNDFAKAKGLLIFMTQTNDKAEGDLNAGEILITDGEVIVKQFNEEKV